MAKTNTGAHRPATRADAARPQRSRDVVGKTSEVVVQGRPLTPAGEVDPLGHVTRAVEAEAQKRHDDNVRATEAAEQDAAAEQKTLRSGTGTAKAKPAGDSALSVKAFRRGFYNGQRIRIGHSFTLKDAADYSPNWMLHVEPGTPNDVPPIHPKLLTTPRGHVTGKVGYADADLSVLGK